MPPLSEEPNSNAPRQPSADALPTGKRRTFLIETVLGLLLAALIGGMTLILQFRRAGTDVAEGNTPLDQSHTVAYTMLGPPIKSSWQVIDNPAKDGWANEAFSAYAKRQLDVLSKLLSKDQPIHKGQLASMVSDECKCSSLMPRNLETIFQEKGLLVERATVFESPNPRLDSSGTGRAGIAVALRSLTEPFRGMKDRRMQIELFRVEALADSIMTRQYVSMSGFSDTGMRQWNAVWAARWVPGLDRVPRMAWIEVEQFEQVRTQSGQHRLFSDCTESVLGDNTCYGEQFLRGYDYWLERTEGTQFLRLMGNPGVALGDVNGDGRDDLYVCQETGLPNRLFLHHADGTARDVSASAGVDWLENSRSALFVDLDNDAKQDLAVAIEGGIVLAEGDGQGHFTIRTVLDTSDDTMSLVAADYDLDARLDLYVCVYSQDTLSERGQGVVLPGLSAGSAVNVNGKGGENSLFRNEIGEDGTWRFIDVTERTGLDSQNDHKSFAAAWEDFDNDGDQDLYVANDNGRNNLYRNDALDSGSRKFVDVSAMNGADDRACGMSVSWGDYDRDGWMDIYISNMFSAAGTRIAFLPQFLASEKNETRQMFQRFTRGNTLLKNASPGEFTDVSLREGVAMGRWAWGSLFADLNNDGWEDLLVTNGFITTDDMGDLSSFYWRRVLSSPTAEEMARATPSERPDRQLKRMVSQGRSFGARERNCCFLNVQARDEALGWFANISAASGIDFSDDGRAIALTDWDQDGKVDVWISNRNAPRLRLMRNESISENHYLALRLKGDGVSTSRDAIGGKVEVVLRHQGQGSENKGHSSTLIKTLRAGEGFLGQSSKWLLFGLGPADEIERVIVHWPGAETEEFNKLEVDHRYLFVQGAGKGDLVAPDNHELRLTPSSPPLPEPTSHAAIRLSVLLPAPYLHYKGFDARDHFQPMLADKSTIVYLWSSSCTSCEADLAEICERENEIRAAGIEVLALAVDGLMQEDSQAPLGKSGPTGDAQSLLSRLGFPFDNGRVTPSLVKEFQNIHNVLIPQHRALPLPTSFLIDPDGRLSVIYKGPLSVDDLLEDAQHVAATRYERLKRSASFTGRAIHDEVVEDARRGAEANTRLQRGAQLQKEKRDIDRASIQYREVVKLRPKSSLARERLGKVQIQRRDFVSAKTHLEEAIRILPSNVRARDNLGVALLSLRKIDEAQQHLEAVVSLHPNYGSGHLNLGLVYWVQRNHVRAKEQFETALRINPRMAQAQNSLARLLATSHKHNVRNSEQALHWAKQAAVLTNYREVSCLDTLAAAFAAAGQFAEAVKWQTQVMQMVPPNERAQFNERLKLYRSGRPYREGIESPFHLQGKNLHSRKSWGRTGDNSIKNLPTLRLNSGAK